MKRIFLSLLLGIIAFVPSASAIIITLDEADANTFAFDVIWGASTGPDAEFRAASLVMSFHDSGGFSSVSGYAQSSSPFLPITSGLAFGFFPFYGSRSFAGASINDVGPDYASSITATPDGYGAHIIFGHIPGSNPVPDGGASAALLGAVMLGVIAVSRCGEYPPLLAHGGSSA